MVASSQTRQFIRDFAAVSILGTIVAMGAGMLGVASLKMQVQGAIMLGLASIGALALSVGMLWKFIQHWAVEVELLRDKARILTDASMEGIWLFVPGTGETFFSKRLRSQLGIDVIQGKDNLMEILDLVVPEDSEKAWNQWGGLIAESTPFSTEVRIRVATGEDKWYRWTGKTSFAQIGNRSMPILAGSLACIHEMRRIEEDVNDIALLAVENPNPVFRMSPKGEILIANKSATPLLSSWNDGIGGAVPDSLLMLLQPAFDSRVPFEMEFAVGDQLFGALFVPHISKGYVNVYCTDVTERARANRALDENRQKLQDLNEKMRAMAQHDALTKLPNRRLFEDRLTMALAQGRRNNCLMALMMIDLDRFKEINDTHGHDAGDALLIGVANRLSNAVRRSDTVARLGGDEFAIVLFDLQEEENAFAIADKILASMVDPVVFNGIPLKTSPSIGITFHRGNEETGPTVLYKRADTAMYQAKRSGRNNYKFYTAEMEDPTPAVI